MRQIRVLVLAGSGSYDDNRNFLPSYWTNVAVELGVALKDINMTPSRRILSHLVQNIKILPILSRYDVILSTGTMNGLLLAFVQTLTRLRRPRHVIIDNALPRIAPPNKRFLLSLSKIVFSSVVKLYVLQVTNGIIGIIHSNSKIKLLLFTLGSIPSFILNQQKE